MSWKPGGRRFGILLVGSFDSATALVLMLLSHKIALDPNKRQQLYFARASGIARFAWNWALGEWQRQYNAGEQPSEGSLRRQLNGIKRKQFPWMYDVSKTAAQEAIINLGITFKVFFEKRGKYPRFKRKDGRQSFCAANEVGTFRADGKRIKLPVVGWVRMREEVRFSGSLKRATVSYDAGRWHVALQIETDDVDPIIHLEPTVGVDLGVSALATLSTGKIIEGPKAHKAALKRLRRANRTLSRKHRGSANFRKAKQRLARLHHRVAAIRRDALHKLTHKLTRTFAVIGLEDLNIRGMMKNRHLARSIADMGFFEFRRQIDYKARLYGARVVFAGRWYPSSKICSCCGVIKETLALAERTFRCTDCGFEAGRDYNAALNLARLAASSAASACGEDRSGKMLRHLVKRASAKQEEGSSEFSERNSKPSTIILTDF